MANVIIAGTLMVLWFALSGDPKEALVCYAVTLAVLALRDIANALEQLKRGP